MDITKLLKSEDLFYIKNTLPKLLLDMSNYCDKILGKGLNGEVTTRTFGETINVIIKDKTIALPVVLKKSLHSGKFNIDIVNDILYLSCDKNLTCEAIMLYYISKLWFSGASPHLPFMVAFSICGDNLQIITEKHGLNKEILLECDIYTQIPDLDYEYKENYKSNLATLQDLFIYVNNNANGDLIVLPNGITCNVVKLFDYITISLLHTYDLLYNKYKISLGDMHSGNIFIHWLNKNSYCGNTYIGDATHIVYYNTKYIRIETYGFVVKVGDIGNSVMNPHKNVFIVGQSQDVNKAIDLLKKCYSKYNPAYYQIIYNLMVGVQYKYFLKMCIFQIFNVYPFNELALFGAIETKYIKDFPRATDLLLTYFNKYVVLIKEEEDILVS